MLRTLLAVLIWILTLSDTIWIVRSQFHYLYVAASILALVQFFDKSLRPWFVRIALLTIALDAMFPTWGKA